MSKERARKIKLIVFDVDGVLTDGSLYFLPISPTTSTPTPSLSAKGEQPPMPDAGMVEVKGFHAHDGVAISLCRLAALKTAIITRRNSQTVAIRARDLNIDYVYQGQLHKLEALAKILEAEKLTEQEVAYVGDDIIDLPVMRKIGLAIAVANAREEVKDESHFVTDRKGGEGAARDAVEYILRAQDRLQDIVSGYIGTH